MRVFVTGGGGFIGRNFIEAVNDSYEVVAPEINDLNLCDRAAVDAWFAGQRRFDVLVHTATTAGHRAASPMGSILDLNLNMYFNLMRHRDKWGRMVVLTSGAVYDVTGPIENATETDLGKRIPGEPSGLSKLAIACHAQTQPNIFELRPFGVFGKYELYNIRFISNAICKALFNLPITLKQDRAFSYVYIDDLVAVMRHFCENPVTGRAFNVTNPESCSLETLAREVRRLVNPSVEIKVTQSGRGLPYTGESRELCAQLPRLNWTSHETAILRLADWYRSIQATLNRESLLEDK